MGYVPHRIIAPASRSQQKDSAQPKQEFEQPEIIDESAYRDPPQSVSGIIPFVEIRRPRFNPEIISKVWK